MNPNTFGRVWDIIWSLFAICGGLVILFNRNWFISSNSRAFLKLYKKTNFSLFKRQAEDMNKEYMHLLVVVLAIFFIVIGIRILVG
ncbi:hypothetical protein ACFL23_02555 [Patescibacteria group bacterium]